MSVLVIKPGLLDTIQDGGRYGSQHLGINPSGAMDFVAATVANMLTGNDKEEAVIELHFPASSFLFENDCMVALSGADFHATINNTSIPVNTAVIISKGSVLQFTQYRHGARCYLAVYGGWDIDYWLNSYSTNIKAAAGGYKGRALKKNDMLHLKITQFIFSTIKNNFAVLPVNADTSPIYYSSKKIRCVEGNEYELLSNDAKELFESSTFYITAHSDRMGYSLHGDKLTALNNKQLISSAVTRGTIQLLPSGNLIILMADHQTTGGYPKIAHVISADMPKLAQTPLNETVQFKLLNHSEAEYLYIELQQYLQQLQDTINLQLRRFFSSDAYY
ncbi:MAG TPA: biotin-dependent carboxyltransferase family protein [Chitinophagaceae bacterium]|jgi:antagonist of KipI